ncbi:hypothetical protein HDU79_010793 [Rhizoclosmatium sp. JEL0117]|nr:hypothetical protein HDU79_010793 [Rhizoclosmatium sp. JEL0117]
MPDDNAILWSLIKLASLLIGSSAASYRRNRAVWNRRFVAHFDLVILSAVDLWIAVEQGFLDYCANLIKLHLLWGLHYLKCYPTEPVFNDKEDWDYLAPSCYMDGVDIEVTEARPLDATLFSHKFNRFQVATVLGTSKIVYISGGTPCGMFNDLDQAQRTLLLELENCKKVAADKGYYGDPRTITKLSGNSDAVKSHNRNITLI